MPSLPYQVRSTVEMRGWGWATQPLTLPSRKDGVVLGCTNGGFSGDCTYPSLKPCNGQTTPILYYYTTTNFVWLGWDQVIIADWLWRIWCCRDGEIASRCDSWSFFLLLSYAPSHTCHQWWCQLRTRELSQTCGVNWEVHVKAMTFVLK